MSEIAHKYAARFRGFLPVVVDVETGGFDSDGDALLEIAAVIVRMDEHGIVHPDPVVSTHVVPFPGANIDPRSLEITGIDPTHPFRAAVEEREALDVIFKPIRKALREFDCQRAILVGHNGVRPGLSQCRDPPHRAQTQSVPPVQLFRYRDAWRAGLWADRPEQGRASCRF